jgi:cbb3-type cytochrome oxidase subunit 3
MKIAVLIFIIFLVIVIFRFFSNLNKKNISNNKEENVIDLEKDPNSDEYKPKE